MIKAGLSYKQVHSVWGKLKLPKQKSQNEASPFPQRRNANINGKEKSMDEKGKLFAKTIPTIPVSIVFLVLTCRHFLFFLGWIEVMHGACNDDCFI